MGFTLAQQCQAERRTHILPSESMRQLIYAVDYALDYSLTLVITEYSISSHLLLAKSNYRAGMRWRPEKIIHLQRGVCLAICAICLALQREEERYQYLMENKFNFHSVSFSLKPNICSYFWMWNMILKCSRVGWYSQSCLKSIPH